MATTYPGTIQTFTNPAAGSVLTTPSHAAQHIVENDTLGSIQTVLGTTAGTSVLKNFVAGDFPSRINSSNVLQQRMSGTIDNAILGTPSLSGGTLSATLIGTSQITGGSIASVVIGTPTITGGSWSTGTITNAVIGTPALTGGTIANVLLGTSTITGGTASALLLGTSTITGGTVNNARIGTVKVRAYQGTAQAIGSASWTKVNLDTETYDLGNNFATNTLTIPTTGYYLLAGRLAFGTPVDQMWAGIAFYKNGTAVSYNLTPASGVKSNGMAVTDVQLFSANDTIDMYTYQDGTTNISLSVGSAITFMTAHLLSL